MITEIVPPALDNERLDRIVALIADVSRAQAAVLVTAGAVRVDGTVIEVGRTKVREGQNLEVDDSQILAPQPPTADETVDFEVLYSDSDIIVVNKPAGLVVHPGAGNPDKTMVNGLLARFPEIAEVGDPMRPGIVHRLDAGSSGLLVVARTSEAMEDLVEQFSAHLATRRYVALVWGHPSAPHGIVDAPIGRDRRDPLKMAVVANGRYARTEYQLLEVFSRPTDLALLECHLHTGRTHQIRVHLTSIGHPLVGDSTYGDRKPILGVARPFLHAQDLTISHPATGETMTFTCPLANDLEQKLAELRAAQPSDTSPE
jgi:23S rRNA pseudouridine1911/1915/1917 synthase